MPSFCEILLDDWQSRFHTARHSMACNPEVFKHVPLFALLDEDEAAVLAGQVELKTFAPRQRIYKMGDSSGQAYVVVSGRVRVSTVDQDHQEVVIDEPSHGEFFGFASMLEQTPHQSEAVAVEEAVCVEVDRSDIAHLLQRKPLAGMDMLTVLGRQFHSSQQLVRLRANRSPNEIIDKDATFGERIADMVAGFGGSWTFIISFFMALVVYMTIDSVLGKKAWDPYPSVSVDARVGAGADHHDEPKPAGHEGPAARRVGLQRQPQSRGGDPGTGAEVEFVGREDGGCGGHAAGEVGAVAVCMLEPQGWTRKSGGLQSPQFLLTGHQARLTSILGDLADSRSRPDSGHGDSRAIKSLKGRSSTVLQTCVARPLN
jgi:CRP-like cAMP-binding protein